MHTPVLFQEAIEALKIIKGGKYIDATVGEGGHFLGIARLGGKVLGIDADEEQIKNSILSFPPKRESSGKTVSPIRAGVTLIHGNFAEIEQIAKKEAFFPVDGVLFDLGLSMKQLRSANKGFSYKNLEDPLDMRISGDLEINAADLLNSLEQNELYEIFALYGEEINSLAISKSVVRARPLVKVKDLVRAIDQVVKGPDKKTYARIFQALRIKVNNELENLKKGLAGALKLLKNDGRIVVISFHSLEDRIVKKFINLNKLKQVNKKIIKSNSDLSFARSAKMRIIEA